ncbi:hypothetical protein OLX02_09270 [Novosphingobium sp. KCTC 2891]|uniref:hypothetical protein n=1 Tax=Novosphingobium sp. KCTC 2891 TaxID=2989730 RepID=UPI0022213A26|nr:hypothetical protein [Novosphingobium sp. KCTC 2891]MCW1383012.1 hypothetical protein [Novosphingobium sp. KCTC 2891]
MFDIAATAVRSATASAAVEPVNPGISAVSAPISGLPAPGEPAAGAFDAALALASDVAAAGKGLPPLAARQDLAAALPQDQAATDAQGAAISDMTTDTDNLPALRHAAAPRAGRPLALPVMLHAAMAERDKQATAQSSATDTPLAPTEPQATAMPSPALIPVLPAIAAAPAQFTAAQATAAAGKTASAPLAASAAPSPDTGAKPAPASAPAPVASAAMPAILSTAIVREIVSPVPAEPQAQSLPEAAPQPAAQIASARAPVGKALSASGDLAQRVAPAATAADKPAAARGPAIAGEKTADHLTLAAPMAQPALIAAVTPDAPAPAAGAAPTQPRAPERIDFATLVDSIARARQDGAAAAPVAVALTHAEFGKVSLHFRAGDDGLSVAMSSPDPAFAPAVAAAREAASAQGAAPDGNRPDAAPRGQQQAAAGGEQSSSNGTARQDSQRGTRTNPSAQHRTGETPRDGGQRDGIFA